MEVPEEIRKVERPVNTVVHVYGKDKNLYSVVARSGCKRVNGRNLPVSGATVGHIINGKYVPCEEEEIPRIEYSPIDIKDWANVKMCDELFDGVLTELRAVYNEKDAETIYCIAILRTCNPGIEDYALKEAYSRSFLSEFYPSVALSKNTVSDFMEHLGMTYSRIVSFMRSRTEKINLDHKLVIDGTLKTDDSRCDTLSEFSRKARVKGSKDLSVLYLFDLDTKEPVCSKCYPGNMLDVTAYGDFVRECGITRGMIVADKGFPSSAIENELKGNPDLHVLNPLRRNSTAAKTHKMYEYDGVLSKYPDVMYKKEKFEGKDKWLYSFRDSGKAFKEEIGWIDRLGEDNPYRNDEYKEKREKFGTIVLESDLDAEPEDIYRAYASRWEIELVMRYYKSALQFTDTREHNDYSVRGSEFCDFLSSVLTYRLLDAFDKAKLLNEHTYGYIMGVLAKAKKGRETPESSWDILQLNPGDEKILISLGLLTVPEPEKRKRGRPRKK